MSLALVHSRACSGIKALPVVIEVHLSKGLPGFSIAGLPETAVKESRHRVRSAILNSQFEFPVRRITVNLAPADLPKEGGRFDLPIALGILAASGQIPCEVLSSYEIIGELALSGELRPCHGIIPMAIAAKEAGRNLILPEANAKESAWVSHLMTYGASNLRAVVAHLLGQAPLLPTQSPELTSLYGKCLDLAEVHGHLHGRRALEIAAAGKHSLLMIGSPGSGKTMLASRLSGILPPLTEMESLDVAAIYSVSRLGFQFSDWGKRPFRSPHHSASSPALIGGGNPPLPGEISLAHRGVLFLDELPEFNRVVLESLREPLESGQAMISRAGNQATFPADFQLVAAMNPCPCGYLGDVKDRCCCSRDQISRYQNKISGPLLDRIDMFLPVQPVTTSQLMENKKFAANESSQLVRKRVILARESQLQRQGKSNAMLSVEEISVLCRLSSADQHFLSEAIESLGLSPRAYHRILKVARTIADLAGNGNIQLSHLQEAISYRRNFLKYF